MDTNWVKITEELLRLAIDVVVGVIVGYAVYLFARKRDEDKHSEERKNYQRQIDVSLQRNKLLEKQIEAQERHRDEDRTEHENELIRAELLEGVDDPDSLEKALRVSRVYSSMDSVNREVIRRSEFPRTGKRTIIFILWFILILLILFLIVALIGFILR